MLEQAKLEQAVETQRRTFELLKWLETALKQGFIQFGSVHAFGSDSEAAGKWIERHFENLPPDGRPTSRDASEIESHAHMLATYLKTSFDVFQDPGVRKAGGCCCWCCTWLEALPHLRPKKLSGKDKRRAQRLKRDAVQQLAIDLHCDLSDAKLEQVLGDSELTIPLALLAYGNQLIRRLKGFTEGPAILALWREFAWNKNGSPKRKFSLKVGDILRAQEQLAEKLTELGATG